MGYWSLKNGSSTEVYFARTDLILNSIWSIKLDAAGEFIATPQLGQANVFNDSANSSVNEIAKIGVQDKITDIEFSAAGKMLLAERGNPHVASISVILSCTPILAISFTELFAESLKTLA